MRVVVDRGRFDLELVDGQHECVVGLEGETLDLPRDARERAAWSEDPGNLPERGRPARNELDGKGRGPDLHRGIRQRDSVGRASGQAEPVANATPPRLIGCQLQSATRRIYP